MVNEKRLDLINKWDVVNQLIRLENDYQFYKEQWDAETLYRRICELEIGIGKTPTVDAVEVVHGEWVRNEDDECYWYTCSECAEYPMRDRWGEEKLTDYCPNCGAKMDGDGNV